MVAHVPSFGVRDYLGVCFSAALTSLAAALLLGRSRLLRSSCPRYPAQRKYHSAFHSLERASPAGNGLAGVLVEGGGLRTSGD